MANRKTLTIDQALPDRDVIIEQTEVAPKPKRKPKPKPANDAPVVPEPYVDLATLWDRYWEAGQRGWADKEKDLQRMIADRSASIKIKDRAVTALMLESSQRRSKLPPFVIMVGRSEQMRIEHLHAGLALMDLLEATGPATRTWLASEGGVVVSSSVSNRAVETTNGRRQAPVQTFKPKTSKAVRAGGDGGMADLADEGRFKARVWSTFVETCEAVGKELTGKPGFGEVNAAVIRGDSGVVAACKAHIRMRLSTAQDVATTTMVAGLDAIIPMFARRK